MSTTRQRLASVACVAAWLVAACGSAGTPATPAPTTTPQPSARPTAPPTPSPVPPPTATPAPTVPAYLDDLQGILAATVGVGNARIAYDIGFDGSTAAPDGPLISGAGEFAIGETQQARMDMDMSAAGLGKLEVIQDGVIVYMRGDAFKAWDPKGRWIRVDTTSDHPNAAAFSGTMSQQTDPWAALYYLLGATAPPEVLGPDTIDGEPVRKLRLQLDLDTAVERAPARARDYLLVQADNMRQQGIAPAFEADLWVDDADRIRRVAYRFDMSTLKGGGQMTMGYDLSDFGLPIKITVPDPKDVVDIETLDLGS